MQGIGWAVKTMQDGQKVRRAGWNGKNMFLYLVPGSNIGRDSARGPVGAVMDALGVETIDYHSHVDMKTAQGYIVPWLCSQADLLATDWELAA